jgi:hypothetical protein
MATPRDIDDVLVMTTSAYRFHSIEAEGPWTSPPFPPAERRHIVQGVIGGFIMGRPRWAEDLNGNFIYGLDAKGKETKAAPAYAPEPTPRRRGKNKPKTATEATGSFRGKRPRVGASFGGAQWGSESPPIQEERARPYWEGVFEPKKTPVQLDAEIAEALRKKTRHATMKKPTPHILTEAGRLADLNRQGFMKRSPMKTWVVAVEAASGDPSEATYIEVQGKTETAALRAAQARKPGARLTVRYSR